jgi:signal transduction histidine kinase
MLSFLGRVPRESRVLVVVSLTVLLQVLVLSGFGLAALKGQEAEAERSTREICAHVLDRYLVTEVNRLIEIEENRIEPAFTSLRVEVPANDPVLGRVLREVAASSKLFRRLFLVTADGAWFDSEKDLIWPVAVPAPISGGSDDPSYLEEVEELTSRPDGLEAAIALLRERLALVDDAEEAEGLLLLARLLISAGRPVEAIAAYDRIVSEDPISRDGIGLLLGPAAARRRAEERLKLLEAGAATAKACVEDLLDLRRVILKNRFQLSEERAAWELSMLRVLAEETAAAMPVAERVMLADGLDELASLSETLTLFREIFADGIRLALRGDGIGGRIHKTTLDGPRAAYLVPIEDLSGRHTAVVVLELDLPTLRTEILPEVLADLPLPPGSAAAVLDANGDVVAGEGKPTGLELAKASLGSALPFYRPVVYLADPDLLNRQTESTRRLHLWIMAASIAGILAAGWFVGRTVSGELKVAKLKSDFLSNVTHELKTPLTSIKMFVETLEEGRVKDEAERQEYLGVISREADRLGGLIQRVLDLARFEGKKSGGLKLAPTDLGRLARDTADLFRLRMGDGGAKLSVSIAEDLPPASLDAAALQEVILNLLGNAVKYGGTEVRLLVAARGKTATIEVADNGIGISEEDQARIFQKFYRADESLARKVEGSGLGLALVREIVRAHGGRVRVKSDKGVGSRFTVTLPLKG